MLPQNNVTVLLAEDDAHFGKILKTYLEARNYNVILASDGEETLKQIYSNNNINIILLDVMMPKKDGFQVAKELKEKQINIPIIFITAKSLQEDILEGFKLGADDYITKPFSIEELFARMNAVLNRTYKTETSQDTNIFQIGKYVFDYKRQILKYEDEEQKLTTREANILKLLCTHLNQVLDRKIALELIWGEYSYFHARNMDVYISKIRKYLRKDPQIELINVHGVGYKLVVTPD